MVVGKLLSPFFAYFQGLTVSFRECDCRTFHAVSNPIYSKIMFVSKKSIMATEKDQKQVPCCILFQEEILVMEETLQDIGIHETLQIDAYCKY